MFSKQHYELLARSFRQELDRGSVDETGRGWLELMARNLAVDLQNDNHRFSTSRFLAACGVREYQIAGPVTATDLLRSKRMAHERTLGRGRTA